MYIGIVVNLLARKNSGDPGARSAELRSILGPWGEVHETRSIDELRLVVQRLDPRVTHLVSDGGDGSLHWLINEIRSKIGDPACWPTFIPTNGGTIDFVARKARVHGPADTIARALCAAAAADRPPGEVWLDSLALDGVMADGAAFHRVGFALAAGGVGNRFFDLYEQDPNPGRAAMMRIIIRTVRDYARTALALTRSDQTGYAATFFMPTRARVFIDGDEVPTRSHNALHAGAFDVNLARILRVFPKASDPGALHFQAGELAARSIIAQLPALVAGRTIRGQRLCDVNGLEMIIEAEDDPLSPIIDGERFPGIARLTVRAGPRVRIAQVG
ncbi:retinol dehydrogenase [Mycolicibacterium hodleri]|uniref:Retinol dehydrogenase n=1 Tax=Mycolicibacterium hodleri TaxID=49897 RepID=A0A502DS66_9MYCO|nr:retinol dehydrogenase [Mycolicibacterium hodleri]TPG28213.1 retinol dehydrogenase [Mycolicibacterium hodleri]